MDIWSKFVELVQKDIECMFGILKKQLHVLKHDVWLLSKDVIHEIFISCCICITCCWILMVGMTGADTWMRLLKMMNSNMQRRHKMNWCIRWNREEVQIMRKAQFNAWQDGLIEHYHYCKEKEST